MSAPRSTAELSQSERRFTAAMSQLGFGRFHNLRVEGGQLVLDPWPASIREIKLSTPADESAASADEFLLKTHVVRLFEFVRSLDSGEIRLLQIKNGLPFLLEFEPRPETFGGRHD